LAYITWFDNQRCSSISRSVCLYLQCEMEQNKESTVAKLQAVKLESGKSYNQLAEETGLTNVYVAQLLRRQAQLKPDTAPVLRAALPGLSEFLLREMMRPPLRSYDPNLIQDPTVYRYSFLFLWGYSLWNKGSIFTLNCGGKVYLLCGVKWVIWSIIMAQSKTHCL